MAGKVSVNGSGERLNLARITKLQRSGGYNTTNPIAMLEIIFFEARGSAQHTTVPKRACRISVWPLPCSNFQRVTNSYRVLF
jgi:hypothetical protein